MKICEEGGCMSKLSGCQLLELFHSAGMAHLNDFEDCAVIPEFSSKLLFTTDFGPLTGKDCRDSGKIAVLNALSDIFAMGGTPLYASIILIVGEDDIDEAESKQLFASMAEACRSEHVDITGGHSIEGKQTIVGLSVIGKQGDTVYKKKGGHIGDVLLLTKPIGTGLALKGHYSGLLDETGYMEAIRILKTSNRLSANILDSPFVHAMTDVTGFGLAGHLTEMLTQGQGALLYRSKLPILPSVMKLSPTAFLNDFMIHNLDYSRERKKIGWHLDAIDKLAVCDPQTNGPILISADRDILKEIDGLGLYPIGEVTDGNEIVLCD